MVIILLALQSGFLSYNRIDKIVNLSVFLFIVASNIIRNISDMTNPQLLLLSTRNNKKLAHFRVLVLVFILISTPIVMTYYFTQIIIVNFWILIISLYCLLTSLHNLCSLMIYALFMIDNFREEPFENLDEAVYCIHGIAYVLEFVVTLFHVCYTIFYFSDLNYFGVCMLLIILYFNVWKNARTGWESLKQKRLAMRKMNLLRHATEDELHSLNDDDNVCPICYQKMTSARVTPCRHYFHGACLKKWLYLYASNDKCPICNSSILENLMQDVSGSEDNSDSVMADRQSTDTMVHNSGSGSIVEEHNADTMVDNSDSCSRVEGQNTNILVDNSDSCIRVDGQNTNTLVDNSDS
ncbi:RING finger protein 145-like, partial [Anneissia japonica]|uniref:RING finger protein 145-like n=1 Tax=Anneissia japonica TaxID=1529436 RepID=UPI0014258676